MARKKPIFRLLDTTGDGTGTTEATGDYSSTPASFRISDTEGWGIIHRMIVYIEDGGSFDSGRYGNGLQLTNGVRVYIRDADDEILAELTSFPVTTNGEWQGQCHDYIHSSYGTGNELASIRWTFSKSGQPAEVRFDQGEYLEVYLNDDFSDLVKHRFTVQGHYTTEEL